MGQLLSCFRRKPKIPVYVSFNGRIVEIHENFPSKIIKVRFNERFFLNYVRFIPARDSGLAHIFIRYPGIVIINGQGNFESGLILDREKTYKEGSNLYITFRPMDFNRPRSSSYVETFDWYSDLTCICIRLNTY